MASEHHYGRPSQEPDEEEIIDIGRGGESDSEEEAPRQAETQRSETPERPKSPAYVAPIPGIGSIPQVSPGIQVPTLDRPNIPSSVASLLVGKLVDEDGDIIDEKTGQVLAHAAGDLPSMVGRRVSNNQGDILGDDGELLGYVADIEWPRARPPPQPRSLFDLMGRATSSLMVDHAGNILDAEGNVVGRFHDNNNPLHRKEREEREARERAQAAQPPKQPPQQQRQQGGGEPQRSPPMTPQPPPQQPQQEKKEDKKEGKAEEERRSQPSAGEGQPRPRRTEEERRQNAEAWRKENPNESPSDIFLDVKSTREGIQLTIRIPTVFSGQQTTPHISFSSQ